ncbi:MAG TPA: hypothetical protein VNZ26_07620, partial [Vicinamibacterales bacterium]|nr:hypothetical protein [Vicinamibacterales bacterium]
VGQKLLVDSRIHSVPVVRLDRGVYPLFVRCSALDGRLDAGVFWDRAGVGPAPLSPGVVFPRPITLAESARLARLETAQRLLLAVAAGIGLLLAIDWARARGPFGWTLVVVAIAAAAAVHFDWPPWVRGTENWVWLYKVEPDRPWFAALAFGVALAGTIALAGTRFARCAPRASSILMLAVGIAVGTGFQLSLLDTEPAGWRNALIDQAADRLGYLHSAAIVDHLSSREFLRQYPKLIPVLSLRASTHPPGGTLIYRGLIGVARQAGYVVDVGAAAGSMRLRRAAVLSKIALAGALIWCVSAALTAVPIALVAWMLTRSALHATVVGLLWLCCPAPVLFTPWLDELDTFLVAGVFSLMLFAQFAPRRAAAWATLSGLLAGASLFISYGTVPMLATAMLMAGFRGDSPEGRQRYLMSMLCCAGGAAAVLAVTVALDFPLVSSALGSLEIHRNVTLSRTASTWLRYNLLDFALCFGAAAVVMVLFTLSRFNWRQPAWRMTMCACVALLAFDVSGTTRAEVGRLWMPFMPLFFAPAAATSLQSGDAVVIAPLMMLSCFALRFHWIVP